MNRYIRPSNLLHLRLLPAVLACPPVSPAMAQAQGPRAKPLLRNAVSLAESCHFEAPLAGRGGFVGWQERREAAVDRRRGSLRLVRVIRRWPSERQLQPSAVGHKQRVVNDRFRESRSVSSSLVTVMAQSVTTTFWADTPWRSRTIACGISCSERPATSGAGAGTN